MLHFKVNVTFFLFQGQNDSSAFGGHLIWEKWNAVNWDYNKYDSDNKFMPAWDFVSPAQLTLSLVTLENGRKVSRLVFDG